MRKIELTQGQVALVDDIDYNYLIQWEWYAAWKLDIRGYYVARKEGKRINQKTIHMHRAIMERVLGRKLERNEQVDHIKGDTLDNRRSELAIKTQSGNLANRGKQRNNILGYKGVSKNKMYLRAQIQINQKLIYLCSQAATEAGKIECAKMYDRAYLYFFGDMATERGMNFPELKEQYLNDLKINTYKWMK